MGTRRRIIEGRWTCSSCGTEGIRGREKTCPACGSPREQEEMTFDFGERDAATGKAKAATVTDAEVVEQAKGGADWFCPGCESGNPAANTACKRCGAPRDADAVEQPERELGEEPEVDAEPEVEAPPPQKKKRGLGGCLLAVFLFAVFCCGGVTFLSQTHEVPGEVSARSWSRSVALEGFTPIQSDGWRSDLSGRGPTTMPKEGVGGVPGVDEMGRCEKKQKGTRQVPDGQEEVCRTKTRSVQCGTTERCTVRDLGNGMAEEVCTDVAQYCDEPYEDCNMETRYRDEPVYGQWCSYSTYAWKPLDTAKSQGQGDEPLAWPALEAEGDLQRAKRSQEHRVTYTYDDDDGEGEGVRTHEEVRADAEAWFESWPMGTPTVLDINRLDSITHIRHQGEEASELTRVE